MEYKITKDQCLNTIKGVCHRCGSNLEPLETVDNAGDPTFWAGCTVCHHFSCGTEKHIYDICKKLVERGEKSYSFEREPEDKTSEEHIYWFRSQVEGFNSIVKFIAKELDDTQKQKRLEPEGQK